MFESWEVQVSCFWLLGDNPIDDQLIPLTPLIPLVPLVPWSSLVLLGSLVPLGSLDIAIMYDLDAYNL